MKPFETESPETLRRLLKAFQAFHDAEESFLVSLIQDTTKPDLLIRKQAGRVEVLSQLCTQVQMVLKSRNQVVYSSDD